jgi:hypothetical protein
MISLIFDGSVPTTNSRFKTLITFVRLLMAALPMQFILSLRVKYGRTVFTIIFLHIVFLLVDPQRSLMRERFAAFTNIFRLVEMHLLDVNVHVILQFKFLIAIQTFLFGTFVLAVDLLDVDF